MAEYDSLLISGSSDAKELVEDKNIQELVRKLYETGAIIGAISIAPILFLKLGYLKNKAFMIGVDKIDLLEEGFTENDLKYMVGWTDSCKGVVEDKYLKTDNIITSVAFGFRQWAMAIGRELDIDLYPRSFYI
ncbi:MAG: DJ-1/PfpI family protein [Peptoniphilaceae bacterium]